MHPTADTKLANTQSGMSAYKRLDLTGQFLDALLDIIGLQDTRQRVPRAHGRLACCNYASAAGPPRQGSLELRVKTTLPFTHDRSLVLYAVIRLLIVGPHAKFGQLELAVVHGLDASYQEADIGNCWAGTTAMLRVHRVRNLHTRWLLDATATLGNITLPTIHARRPSQDKLSGPLLHDLLLERDMALPTTFNDDPAIGRTWQTATDKRLGDAYVELVALCRASRRGY